MIETGIAIFLSLVFLFIKLPRRWLLRMLRYDLTIDIAVTLLVLLVHWGTFSGLMAATFAGLLTSLATSAARRLVGYIHGTKYYPGIFNVKV